MWLTKGDIVGLLFALDKKQANNTRRVLKEIEQQKKELKQQKQELEQQKQEIATKSSNEASLGVVNNKASNSIEQPSRTIGGYLYSGKEISEVRWQYFWEFNSLYDLENGISKTEEEKLEQASKINQKVDDRVEEHFILLGKIKEGKVTQEDFYKIVYRERDAYLKRGDLMSRLKKEKITQEQYDRGLYRVQNALDRYNTKAISLVGGNLGRTI